MVWLFPRRSQILEVIFLRMSSSGWKSSGQNSSVLIPLFCGGDGGIEKILPIKSSGFESSRLKYVYGVPSSHEMESGIFHVFIKVPKITANPCDP